MPPRKRLRACDSLADAVLAVMFRLVADNVEGSHSVCIELGREAPDVGGKVERAVSVIVGALLSTTASPASARDFLYPRLAWQLLERAPANLKMFSTRAIGMDGSIDADAPAITSALFVVSGDELLSAMGNVIDDVIVQNASTTETVMHVFTSVCEEGGISGHDLRDALVRCVPRLASDGYERVAVAVLDAGDP